MRRGENRKIVFADLSIETDGETSTFTMNSGSGDRMEEKGQTIPFAKIIATR
jgi:hypothetical protein